MSVDRRSFLGVFGGVAAGGLILKASDADIAQFSRELKALEPIHAETLPKEAPAGSFEMGPGDTLYDAKGNPVAVVTRIEFNTDRIDVTSWGDEQFGGFYQTYVSGLRHAKLTAEVITPGIQRRKNG